MSPLELLTHSSAAASALPPPPHGGPDSGLETERTAKLGAERPVLATTPIVGSLGVRGLIDGHSATSPAEQSIALEAALDALRADGVRRAHILVPGSSRLGAIAEIHGFHVCPGESLYTRALPDAPEEVGVTNAAATLRSGSLDDLIRIGIGLSAVPELAFEPWEIPLVARDIGADRRVFKVVTVDGAIAGAAIGGTLGDVGTISHLWIAPEYRHLHLGAALCAETLSALHAAGARSVYLMTTAGNVGANRFWERQGFSQSASAYFMEIDL